MPGRGGRVYPLKGQGRGDLRTQSWKRLRKTVLERDGYECQIRGYRCKGQATEVDHIVPHIAGGDEQLTNLRAACKPCNSAAGARQRTGGAFLTHPPTHRPPISNLSPQGRSGPTTGMWHTDLPA